MRLKPLPTLSSIAAAALFAAGTASVHAADQPIIGLITKTETNPFFVKMKEGANEAAKAKGAKLLSGAGCEQGSGGDRRQDRQGLQAHVLSPGVVGSGCESAYRQRAAKYGQRRLINQVD